MTSLFPTILRAARLMLFGAGLAGLSAANSASAAEIQPVTPFDIKQYSGKWYELYRLDHRFERDLSNVTANYRLQQDGTVEVENRGFNTKKCKWNDATGTAKFRGPTDVADLKVTFFWPFSGAYKVFELDHQGYRWAAVAGDNLNYLWILSRSPTLPAGVEQKLLNRAAQLGYDTGKLIKVDHSTPNC